MPYVIEHAARVREPSEFRKGTFRRKSLMKNVVKMVKKGKGWVPKISKVPNGVRIITGKLKGGGTSMLVQAYRFDKTTFTPAEAKKWLKAEGVIWIRFDQQSRSTPGEMMKTTAAYRAEAKVHEKALRWAKAAKCWEMAIRIYPKKALNSSMAEFDIRNMTARMDECKRAAARKKREEGRK